MVCVILFLLGYGPLVLGLACGLPVGPGGLPAPGVLPLLSARCRWGVRLLVFEPRGLFAAIAAATLACTLAACAFRWGAFSALAVARVDRGRRKRVALARMVTSVHLRL